MMASLIVTHMKWIVSCTTAFAFVASAHGASEGDQLVKSLLECSPKYFASVRSMASFSSAGYTFTSKGRLIVPNARDEVASGYRVMGVMPIETGGLTVVGMYDLHRKANTFEMFDWGLLVRGDAVSLVKKLNSLLSAEQTFESDGVFGFARLEKTSVKTWPKWVVQKPLPSRAGIDFGDLEILAEITLADEQLPGISRIGCSLQGVFPPFVLQQRRPDID